eukprot:CAMPEP_0194375732 /NCGR_PEP_ID=MMETSP0174-20130528/24284_1 /TAXON_ID=216777 /ORGANISM="Proboscia alata, Strain PI-D3" /LENGTH=138 /DNA_ID=CAMNT_0039156135 /DNA_START=27 /DNA_END=439 /DNA_ORIENTATION=+
MPVTNASNIDNTTVQITKKKANKNSIENSNNNSNDKINEKGGKPSSALPLEMVNLGEWIGEGFLAEECNRHLYNLSHILSDRDDEFLGCSKNGDSTPSVWSRRLEQKRKRNISKNKSSSVSAAANTVTPAASKKRKRT